LSFPSRKPKMAFLIVTVHVSCEPDPRVDLPLWSGRRDDRGVDGDCGGAVHRLLPSRSWTGPRIGPLERRTWSWVRQGTCQLRHAARPNVTRHAGGPPLALGGEAPGTSSFPRQRSRPPSTLGGGRSYCSRMNPWRAALTSATASGKSTRIASR